MITIIDYDAGNLKSVTNALEKLGIESQISDDPAVVRETDALILPGVGSAQSGMKSLKEKGLDTALIEKIKSGTPFLGICLGMQILFDSSEEGDTKCLRILKGKVKKFRERRKIPQIGWNRTKFQISNDKCKTLLQKIPDNSYFYFVNSYYCIPEDYSIVAGTTIYGETFASVIVKNNIVATQFHPEKSGIVGFQLLRNFFKSCVPKARP